MGKKKSGLWAYIKDILGYLFMTFFSACLAIAMINEEASIGFILFACAAAFVQAGQKWRKVCGNDRGRDPLFRNRRQRRVRHAIGQSG